MYNAFFTPILSSLSTDNTFQYLPLLTYYQISTKSFCKLCYGLLNNIGKYHLRGNQLHLETLHNYPCPNTKCHAAFVLNSHLNIHLKICDQTVKLKNLMKKNQYEKYINFKINSPVDDYYQIVSPNDVNPTIKWVQNQRKLRQKRKLNELSTIPSNKQYISSNNIEKIQMLGILFITYF